LSHLRYFLTGNTAGGYQTLIPEALKSINNVCLVDGPYLSDNSEIMERIYEAFRQDDVQLELVHHPSDPEHLQAIIFPDINLAVLSSTPPHRISIDDHTRSITTLNVYDFYDIASLSAHQSIIDAWTLKITELHQEAYRGYAEALNIHDEWEKIYIEQSSFAAANAFAQQLASKLFPEERLGQSASIKTRFLGAATPKGAVDFIPELTAGLKRYLIKGRPGSGKSTLLRKLVARGQELNYDIEVYQCGLDPNSLDMVICRELGFAIFDSTAPHEYEPTLDNDEIIDMYEISIAPDTDKRFSKELAEVASRYREQMKRSNQALAQAAELEEKRSALTKAALNVERLKQVEQILIHSIATLAERHHNNK